ncbi:maternal protein tudor-like [Athalia rosae]|uniref:maternal protein tudor-like n=1 Tax=Athalia rosae TaxID=37344 RepID=UPI002033D053|nr:maternal protein tudor-like [Athalia rosae]
MTAMAPNSELMLFVTHVETDGPLLKIWGQIDRTAATCVEKTILPLTEKFTQGLGAPNPDCKLPLNLICCARFQNEGYFRAKVCGVQPNGQVLLHFIDYGNYEVVPLSAIRLLDNIPSALSLISLPAIAIDFTLAGILPVNGRWDAETVESIKQSLRYADSKGLFHSAVGPYRFLKLCYNNQDFSELLVSRNIATRASVQDMLLTVRQLQPQELRSPQFKRNVCPPPPPGNYLPRPMSNVYTDSPMRSNNTYEDWRSAQHRQQPVHVQEALVFKSRVLDVGSIHEVMVSFIEDGPYKFSIQVKSMSGILSKLMTDINRHPTTPLQEPPLPGSVCLGRYSHEKVLCRAVVMAVMEQKCKVWYVDFGHTEALPYSDIFQLPPQYIIPRVLSIRFTLSGIKDMVIDQKTKDYFKKLVDKKLLVLQVRPPEGPPLVQYGDLYDNGTNIRDILEKTCAMTATVFYQEPPKLQRGMKNVVHVSFVESCTKFFVQLDSGVKSLNSIMACLAEYAQNAPPLDEKHLQIGWPCCASYIEDKQWYRAQILSVSGEQVTVLYVDYGNKETVTVSALRKIHEDLVKNLRCQAISCALNGFQSSESNQEVANQFESLVLERQLTMEVVDVVPNGPIINLLDHTVSPPMNIAAQLSVSITPSRNIKPSNTRRDTEQVLNLSQDAETKYPSEDRNGKWEKKSNNWGQDSMPGDMGMRNRRPPHEHTNGDRREQFHDKTRTKTAKDVENEQRQRDNNRPEGDDRLHHKETRNNYFNRNDSATGNRYERNDDGANRKGGKGGRFGSGGNSREENRSDRSMNKDDSWSDKDSDTSSRGSGRRGSKRPRGAKGQGDRGGRRGDDRKSNSGKWSDGDNDRSSSKSSTSGFRPRDKNLSSSSWKNAKPQANKSGSWNSMSPKSPVKEKPKTQKLTIPSPNITVGAVKTVELTYMESPTNFYVQLCPDNIELDAIMEKIAGIYNEGGDIVKTSDIQPELCCIAQYSCDSTWYRAIVKANNGGTATVKFIDYGNSEVVAYDKIKELQPVFAKLSAQAVHCKLFGASKSVWTDGEIDSFSQSAEGIPLEAEFITQDNEVYEVLLKPINNDASDSNCVNKQYCGDLDLIQAKKEVKDRRKNGGRRTPQYISAQEKWRDESFTPGYEVDVVVTWFVNPNNFYCQLLSRQSEFRNMMNEIQESYVVQRPVKNALQVNAPVIAFFSDDGALYRAEIKELNKLRGHIVQYVDFGNRAMVDPSKIYPVEKKFAVLPKQAMHCTLKNVSPTSGSDWSRANKQQVDRYFDADKYKCTFHGKKDGKYLISLSNNGKDVGDSMIAAGLAVNSEAKIATVVNRVTTPEAKPSDHISNKQDLTYWAGHTIRTNVSNVQGAAKFYIQLPASIESPKPVDNLHNSMLEIPHHLVECYLFDTSPTPNVDDILKNSAEGKCLIVRIKNVENNRLVVQLYDVSGKRLLHSDTSDCISPVFPLPISATTDKVWVTQIEDTKNIWLQRSSDSEIIANFLAVLFKYYSTSGTQQEPEVGKLCAAQSQDQNWYRATIENVTDTGVTVRFIDYGNTEEVSLESIKVLEQQFYVPHQLAIKVSLGLTLKGTEEEQDELLHNHLNDKEFTASFVKVGDEWIARLTLNDKTLNEIFKELGVVEAKKTEPEQQEIPEMIVGNRYEVFLSHADSPAQFWLQRNEEIDALEIMQADLQIVAPNFSPITGVPEEGSLCAALYSVDNLWYRAEVLDADEDITTVRFIDYGNTDVVDTTSSNIKELPENWQLIKKYALKSRLDLIPIGSEDWSTASCEMFENMATPTNSITALIIADSVPRRVELFVEQNSIGETLVKEGHAIMVHNVEDLNEEIIDVVLDPRSAFVSHLNSPGEFWVQEEKSVSDLETMSDRFMVAEMYPKLEEIEVGTLCVARFPDDYQWYRARINSHGPAGTQVLYIDYGNSAVSTEIRTIPKDLALIPPLSRKCCLQLPAGAREWSQNACDKFAELAADGATIFLLDVISEGETSVVNLTLDGVNVADELIRLCDFLPVIDERLPPLGEENSPNIVVSHVNSLTEFWTQAESSITELETMASRLVDAESLLPLNNFEEGTICAAKFPEDGQWYRAKILSHGDSGTNVLYFDYGNSAVTNQLRILPEDVAKIPSLATQCSLQLPENVEDWSEEASEKFIELVADGATMFQFEILNTDVSTLISLQLDGKDVVDILKPLCKKKVVAEGCDIEFIETTKTAESDKPTEDRQILIVNDPAEKPTEDTIKSAACDTAVVLEAEKGKISSEVAKIETGNVEIRATDNLDETENIQTDNVEAEKAQINDDNTQVKQVMTNIQEAAESESISTAFESDICENKQAEPEYLEIESVQSNETHNESEITPSQTESSDISGAELVEETYGVTNKVESVNDIEVATDSFEFLATKNSHLPEQISSTNLSAHVPQVAPVEIQLDLQIPVAETDVTISAESPKIMEEQYSDVQSHVADAVMLDEPVKVTNGVNVTQISDEPAEISAISVTVLTNDLENSSEPSTTESMTETTMVKELTVDEIVENMVKVEIASPVKEALAEDKIFEDGTQKACAPNDTLEEEILPKDASGDTDTGVHQKTPKIDKIVPGSICRGSIDEDIPISVLVRRRSSCTDEQIVPGAINKGNDLTQSESEDLLDQESEAVTKIQKSVVPEVVEITPVTPGKMKQEEKIVPGSVSRGESPSIELNHPATPKTPHSEKLVAGVVNLSETLTDYDEPDEILTVEVENNIPENRS